MKIRNIKNIIITSTYAYILIIIIIIFYMIYNGNYIIGIIFLVPNYFLMNKYKYIVESFDEDGLNILNVLNFRKEKILFINIENIAVGGFPEYGYAFIFKNGKKKYFTKLYLNPFILDDDEIQNFLVNKVGVKKVNWDVNIKK